MKKLFAIIFILLLSSCTEDVPKEVCYSTDIKVGQCYILEAGGNSMTFKVEKIGDHSIGLAKRIKKNDTRTWESGYKLQRKKFPDKYHLEITDCPDTFYKSRKKDKWK